MTADTDARIARAIGRADEPEDITREEGLEPDPHADRTRNLTHTSFSRMRTTWVGADEIRIAEVNYQAEQAVRAQFRVALDLMDQIYLHVRKPRTDDNEMPLAGSDGRPLWVCDENGNPEEDWSRVYRNDQIRNGLLHAITVHLYEWEQRAAFMWGEAMFAKVQWEERFSNGFLNLPGLSITGKPTEADRTQSGHRHSIDDRYFAVFQAILSRKADALVRSMTRLQKLLSIAPSE